MESPCECGIEPPGSISHGVSYLYAGLLNLEKSIELDLNHIPWDSKLVIYQETTETDRLVVIETSVNPS